MSEFKFSCPHCDQHIQCDSKFSGRQIQCPGLDLAAVVVAHVEDDLGDTRSPATSRPSQRAFGEERRAAGFVLKTHCNQTQAVGGTPTGAVETTRSPLVSHIIPV